MLVLLPMLSVGDNFRRKFQVYGAPVTGHTRVERLVIEIEPETESVPIVRNRSVEVVDQKLRGDPGHLHSAIA